MCMLGGKCSVKYSQLEYYTNDLNNEHVPACLLWIKYIASYQDHSVASQFFPIGSSSATAIASSVLPNASTPGLPYATKLLLLGYHHSSFTNCKLGPKSLYLLIPNYLKFPYDHIFA